MFCRACNCASMHTHKQWSVPNVKTAMRWYIYRIEFGMLEARKNEISLRKLSGATTHLRSSEGNTGLQPLIVWLVHSLSEDNTCLCFATCKRNTQTCFNLRPICFVDEPGVARRKSLFLLLRPRVAEPCTSAELPVATKQRINAWHVLSADWPLHKCFALSKSDALAPGSCDTSFY